MLNPITESPPKTLSEVQTQALPLTAAAQAVYEAWDESDVDTYAGGGICHLIADAFCEVLSEADIQAASISSPHEQHVYVLLQTAQGVYSLDLPWYRYERGGGFSWTKLPDVVFSQDDLVWLLIDRNPDKFDDLTLD